MKTSMTMKTMMNLVESGEVILLVKKKDENSSYAVAWNYQAVTIYEGKYLFKELEAFTFPEVPSFEEVKSKAAHYLDCYLAGLS